MKKYVYRKQASIQLAENHHHPGCIWGALHMLDYLAWRQVRKMLPYKRHAGARPPDVFQGNNGHIIRGDDVQHDDSSVTVQRMTGSLNHTGNSVRSNKGSVRARLKSRIVEDILRRKGKHHRSSTYPAQSKSDPANVLAAESKDSDLIEHDVSADSVKSDPLPPKDDDASVLTMEAIDDDCKVQWVTFGDNSVDNLNDHDNGESPLSVLAKASMENETVTSPNRRSKEKSQVAIRHFKILRRRLKHAIKESKKENHHIAMDGVLHKIPYGHKLSADVKEITSYWKERSAYRSKKDGSPRSGGLASPVNQKGKRTHFRRTSSTGDSMEKYCWLYESSFKKKSNQPEENSEEIIKEDQSKKSLGRILSMPDLKSYYYIPSEYLHDSFTARSPSRSSADGRNSLSRNLSFVYEPLNEGKLPTSPAADELAESLANAIATEKLTPTSDDFDQDFEFSFPQTAATTASIAFDELSSSSGKTHCSDLEFVPREDSQQRDTEADSADKNLSKLDSKEQTHQNDVEFKYVKNVLDLSGLSRNHPHESWHSTDQPVDPAVFYEVEDYKQDSDSYNNNNNNLILFDLINEVLIDMYEKSFSYCPVPLSSLCSLRSMPKGDRVVNEVWLNISWYLSSRFGVDDKVDYVVGRDLAKSSGWMNLQFDSECVGLELEDMIFEDLLDEIVG